jgi:hypothetical protein
MQNILNLLLQARKWESQYLLFRNQAIGRQRHLQILPQIFRRFARRFDRYREPFQNGRHKTKLEIDH